MRRASQSPGNISIAYVIPRSRKILLKTGPKSGATKFVSPNQFKGKILRPTKWDQSGLFVYRDFCVRDKHGRYVGQYIGCDSDGFGVSFPKERSKFVEHIFIKKRSGSLFSVRYDGWEENVRLEYIVVSRVSAYTSWDLPSNEDDFKRPPREVTGRDKEGMLKALEEYKHLPLSLLEALIAVHPNNYENLRVTYNRERKFHDEF